jgi:CDP-glucose 4,6-dehydratase
LWLQKLGAHLTGFSLQPSTNPNFFDIAQVDQDMVSIIGDIRDGDLLANALKQAAPDIVIHMAAQPLVRSSYLDPVKTYSTNIMGTINLLEAVRKYLPQIRAVVNITTDKCYENKEWIWGYRENDSLGGFDPYSSSKSCAELVSAAYRNSYFNPTNSELSKVGLATARAGNVIGGGDWSEDRLIPDILRSINNSKSIEIRNPHSVRPWQHVFEPLNGYLLLAEKLYLQGGGYGEAFNFGPREDDAKSVLYIVENFAKYWGEGLTWKFDSALHPHEAQFLKLDCSKANLKLNWQPQWNLNKAIESTVAWQKAYICQKNMRAYSLEQIDEYLKLQNSSEANKDFIKEKP